MTDPIYLTRFIFVSKFEEECRNRDNLIRLEISIYCSVCIQTSGNNTSYILSCGKCTKFEELMESMALVFLKSLQYFSQSLNLRSINIICYSCNISEKHVYMLLKIVESTMFLILHSFFHLILLYRFYVGFNNLSIKSTLCNVKRGLNVSAKCI